MNDSELNIVIHFTIGYDSSMDNHKSVSKEFFKHLLTFNGHFCEIEDYAILTQLAGVKGNEPPDDTYNDS